MDELLQIREALEKHMVKFHLIHGPNDYEELKDFSKKTGYPYDKVIPISKTLIHQEYALPYGSHHKGCLKLTKLGMKTFSKNQKVVNPSTIIQGNTITGENVTLGNSNINISKTTNFFEDVNRQIQESKDIAEKDKKPIVDTINKWASVPAIHEIFKRTLDNLF